jgi:ParB-like chromosome segregation protein Spo0J
MHMINDNFLRRQLDPLARALLARELLRIAHQRRADGIHPARRLRDEVGALLNLSGRQVERLVSLLDLPREVQREISHGRLTQGRGEALLGVPPEGLQRVVEAIREEANVQDVVDAVLQGSTACKQRAVKDVAIAALHRFVEVAEKRLPARRSISAADRQLIDKADRLVQRLKKHKVTK